MVVRASNKKVNWIERRTKWLKKRNDALIDSDAEAQARKLYA